MQQTEIIKNAIVRTLLESEIGSIESDGTRSMAGFIRRDQYHDMADKILKLVVQPDVIKLVCEKCGLSLENGLCKNWNCYNPDDSFGSILSRA